MHPEILSALLPRIDGVNALIPHAKRLVELRQIMSQALPASLSQHCTVANYRQGKIVVFAENSAVAAKVKLMRATLGAQFLLRGWQVTAIEVVVQPREPQAGAPGKRAVLTLDASRAIAGLSSQLTDSQLKSSLSLLASRVRK